MNWWETVSAIKHVLSKYTIQAKKYNLQADVFFWDTLVCDFRWQQDFILFRDPILNWILKDINRIVNKAKNEDNFYRWIYDLIR